MPPRSAPPVPPLAVRRQPGLSRTLTGPRIPSRCQSCGATGMAAKLERWIECDEWDQPTHVVVVLCGPCARRLIDPHHRLYHPLWPNEPHPGAMGICVKCRHRRGTACGHPDARENGGAGVTVEIDPPAIAHLCIAGPNGRRGETRRIYSSPARGCSGREIAPEAVVTDTSQNVAQDVPAPP